MLKETEDNSVGIFGHGSKGLISVSYKESPSTDDVKEIADWRIKHHKKKFDYFMVNECDVMSDPRMINQLLRIARRVSGYKGTCIGISGLRDEWTTRVSEK